MVSRLFPRDHSDFIPIGIFLFTAWSDLSIMQRKKKTLLWRLPGETGDSYLLGTAHTRDERVFRQVDLWKSLLAQCDVFAAEYDLNSPPPLGAERGMLFPQGAGISTRLRPSQYQRLQQILQRRLQLDLASLEHYKPLLVVSLIDELLVARDAPEPLDAYLWKQAQSIGLTCTGVETYAQQLAVIAAIPVEQQLADLRRLSRHLGDRNRRLERMLASYVKGDPQALYQSTRRHAGSARHLLLFARNHYMVGRIKLLAEQAPTFFAIGAGHLGGDQGVLAGLKRAGVPLDPLPWGL